MIQYLFRSTNEPQIQKDTDTSDSNSLSSPKYKMKKNNIFKNNIDLIEEEILKDLKINYKLMNIIYEINNTVKNNENSVIKTELLKILNIVDKKKNILLNTTKNTYKVTSFNTVQMQCLQNYVDDFNKLLDVSIELINQLNLKC